MIGLFIVPTDLESLERKGVVSGVLDRDESGLLDLAVTVHPFASDARRVVMTERHIVYEFKQPTQTSVRAVRWLSLIFHLMRSALRVRRLVRCHRVDFVRAQDPFFCGLIGFIAARLARVPFCISIHADYEKVEELAPGSTVPRLFGSPWAMKWLQRILLRRADLVLVISDYIGRYALAHGAVRDRVRLFRHMISLSDFAAPARPDAVALADLPPNRRVISVVSRLSRQKFIYDVLEMAHRLSQRRDDFAILIAGEGEEGESLRRLIDQDSLGPYVRLMGFVPQPVVAALRQNSSACLALLDGRSLMEACAAGRPVVGYDVEWHAEIVESGVTGLLVKEGDIDALTEAVDWLLDHPEEADQMGEAGRRRVSDVYAFERLIADRRNVYRELVSRKSTPRTALSANSRTHIDA